MERSKGSDFYWIVEKDPTMGEWQAEAVTFMAAQTKAVSSIRTAVNHFLNYIQSDLQLSRDPRDYVRQAPAIRFDEWMLANRQNRGRSRVTYINYAIRFLNDIISRYWMEDGVVIPGVRNPIIPVTNPEPQRTETHREPMPSRWVRQLIEILTEDDFAWPRSMKNIGKGGDYFSRQDPATGQTVEIWSPVRAIAILLKLHLPLRTFQIRMLNSGEMDPEVYDVWRGWLKNDGPLAPRSSERRQAQGFLRRFRDTQTHRDFTGFFVNTNKTRDRRRGDIDGGYEIPWHHDQVIRWICYLRDWQIEYNPVAAPTAWSELRLGDVPRNHSRAQLERRGADTFLFRDPCYPGHQHEPVTNHRLHYFWVKLLTELEQRLAVAGETLPNGSPITLIERWAVKPSGARYPVIPRYDLHSLRVTLLTAMATEGGVPLPVLAKCVAGHATVLMTLYYQKLGISYVTEILTEAQQRLEQNEQANWERFLQDASYDELLNKTAYTARDAVEAVRETNPQGWAVLEFGLCPVGCAKCHEGGAKCHTGQKQEYQPVPPAPNGEIANCPRCRFFVTGPAFLVGLICRFNAVGLALQEKAQRRRDAEARLEAIARERQATEQAGQRFLRLKAYAAADELLDRRTQDLDNTAHTWHSLHRLIERCLALLHRSDDDQITNAGDSPVQLVLRGQATDLETVLEEVTRFELFDTVCHAAEFYLDIDHTPVTGWRSQILDAVLTHNHCRPLFYSLSREDQLNVGNAMTRFLVARLGRTDTVALIAGKQLLEDVGLAAEVEALLAEQLPGPMRIIGGHLINLSPAGDRSQRVRDTSSGRGDKR